MRRTIVTSSISHVIGACQLTRQGVVRLLTSLHGSLPRRYAEFQHLRHPEDERLFFYFDVMLDEGALHTFTFHIDDSTSSVHLIVAQLEHSVRAE